ncbi:MAG: DUF4097 family beta strand repeat protein [Candidatus Eremiobacteraeota bacterium]|nr:DUF4097 family beta strand repeat protein [Candidatus Eremiobacteraeota bacterium]
MSRSALVAMLVAVEVLIVGMAVYVVRGACAMHHADYTAAAIAPVDAGAAPRITVDDVDSRVVVAASHDGLVHVKDLTSAHGAFFGERPSFAKLDVKRIPGGVAIARSESHGVRFQIGWSEQRVEIDAPAGSQLEIAHCAGAQVNGIEGGVAIMSQDGRIELADVSGTVRAHSDDGRIVLTNVAASTLDAQTKSGSIEAHNLSVAGGAPRAVLHTDDGSIRVALAAGADLTVDASTNDGHVIVNGESYTNSGDGDSAQHTVRLGNGSGSLQLSSDDGSIHLTTNGAV